MYNYYLFSQIFLKKFVELQEMSTGQLICNLRPVTLPAGN